MAARDEIVAFCDDLLDVDSFADYGPNGLQFPGSAEVGRVVSGVSASRELLERAAAANADLVLAHHGLFWEFHPRRVTGPMKAKLAVLLDHDISLAAYHLPLDAHSEIGNNALLCDGLGLQRGAPFAEAKGAAIGWVGRAQEPLALEDLVERVRALTGNEPLVFDAGPNQITTVGIVSGAGSSSIGEAIELGLDAILTGEPAEHAMADAREGGIHFIAAGHYATETHGIRRLGELVAERFGIDHEFVEIPNPV